MAQSDDDLYAVTTGTPAPKSGGAPQPTDVRDLLARYVLGEAGGEPDVGQQAVVAVAKNVAGGDPAKLASVITSPGFSEAWSNPKTRAKLLAISPNDPAYQQAYRNASYVLGSTFDPTGGATHYLNPDLQTGEGRAIPPWAQGTGTRIGKHVFYGGAGNPNETGYAAPTAQTGAGTGAHQFTDDELAAIIAKEPGADPNHTGGGTPLPPATPNPLNAPDTHRQIEGGNLGDLGSGFVQGLRDVGTNLVLRPAAVVDRATGSPLGTGVVEAPLNLLTAFGATLPSAGQMVGAENLLTQRYNASPQSDTVLAQTGRFGGQMAPLLPLGATGRVLGAGADALEGASPVASNALRFLSGEAAAEPVEGNMLMRAGNAAVRIGSQATHNALQGAIAGQATDQNPIGGAIGGAVAGPLLNAAGRGGAMAYNSARNMVAPFTEGGRAGMADRFLAKMAANGPTDINANMLVPGSMPTLDQATGNAGLASLRRVISTASPEATNQFAAREAANNAARQDFLQNLRGDKSTLDAMQAARDQAASQARAKAFTGAAPADVSPVVQQIDQILAGPSGQRDAVQSALADVRSKLVQPVDLGNGQTVLHAESDPEQLYGIRQHITDLLDPLAAQTKPGPKLAAKQLLQVKDALDGAIEQSAPGYKQYLADYAEASKPISSKQFLQSASLTDMNGNPTLAKVQNVLESVRKGALKGGVGGPKSVTDEDIAALQTLRDDLARENLQARGKAKGSDTFQNLATNNLLLNAGLPAAGAAFAVHSPSAADFALPLLWGQIRNAYAKQNPRIADALVNRLLHPDLASRAFDQNTAFGAPVRNLLRNATPYLPVVSGMVAGNKLQVAQ